MAELVNFSILSRNFFKKLENSKISIWAKFLVLRYQKNSRKTPNARFELHTFFWPSRDPVRSSRGPQMAEAHDNGHIRFSKKNALEKMVRIWVGQTEFHLEVPIPLPTYPYMFLWLFGYVFNVFWWFSFFSRSDHPPPTPLKLTLRRPFLDFRQKMLQKWAKKVKKAENHQKSPQNRSNHPKIDFKVFLRVIQSS